MAVTITGGQLNTNTSWQKLETLTQSTATAFRAISVRADATVLGMGTATGTAARNIYSLATTGVEGQEKFIYSAATGEASVLIPMPSGRLNIQACMLAVPSATTVDALQASATGMWVFQSDGDFLLLQFMNGAWNVINGSGATLATTT
jgi:hypothetical protein